MNERLEYTPSPYRCHSLEGIEGNVNVAEYVSRQKWSSVFDADTAMIEGTIFPEFIEAFEKEGKNIEGNE
ncbi:spore coat associated protein CotJA [Anaerosporobacter faecicola]|uniref:spore coat associated protein CotJA n=1 Tax=Anaerosporobacter faecicola TaxID=2718714 RepID=UPI00143ABEF6|nr:spore coat associated protein CotJA [Anaerosporobacter faecicola]